MRARDAVKSHPLEFSAGLRQETPVRRLKPKASALQEAPVSGRAETRPANTLKVLIV
jgi:hypothetical protein